MGSMAVVCPVSTSTLSLSQVQCVLTSCDLYELGGSDTLNASVLYKAPKSLIQEISLKNAAVKCSHPPLAASKNKVSTPVSISPNGPVNTWAQGKCTFSLVSSLALRGPPSLPLT